MLKIPKVETDSTLGIFAKANSFLMSISSFNVLDYLEKKNEQDRQERLRRQDNESKNDFSHCEVTLNI